MNPEWRSRYEAAVSAAQHAGRHALSYFDRGVTVEWKADKSPVTLADREAEEHLRASLLGSFPNDGFLGEEFGDQPGTSGFRWIVDPIDGTRSFVRNIPIWATLIGLGTGTNRSRACLLPAMGGVTYRALRGDGATGTTAASAYRTSALSDSILFY